MKIQIISSGCFLLVLCSRIYCSADIVSSSIDSIVAEYNKANVACREYSESDLKELEKRVSSEKKLKNTLLKADIEIKNNIIKLIEELGDVKTVLKNTDKIITWREFPKDNSHAKRMEFEYDKELNNQKLRINYMSWSGVEGETFYLLQNSFWNLRENGIRIIPSTYVLILNDKYLSKQDFISDYFLLSGGEVPYPLGVIYWEKGPADILILRGPAGSGAFSKYLLYAYNARLKQFEVECQVAETDGVVDYSYDDKANQLRYKRYAPVENHNIEEVVCQMCGPDSPLKLKIFSIKEVNYNSDYAPINIELCNAGLQPVKFGNAYCHKDERGYIGSFSVILHKNDGTQVLNVPGEIVGKTLEAKVFQLDPNEKVSFTLDLSKLYNVNRLKPGEYKLCVNFLTTNPTITNYFSGMLKSNTIELSVGGNYN